MFSLQLVVFGGVCTKAEQLHYPVELFMLDLGMLALHNWVRV